MNKKIAKIISNIFNAYFALVLSTFLIIYTQRDGISNWIFVLALSLILPAIQTALFLKLGLISDLDITNRKERPLYHIIGLIPHIFLLTIALNSQSALFLQFELILFSIYFLMGIISFWWKISGHMIFNTILVYIILFLNFNWYLLFVFVILLPLIAYSRVVLKKHTIAQVIGGTILSLILCTLLLL